MKFNSFTQVALRAARIGGEILSRDFNRHVRVEYKGAIDPVTDADRASQDAILAHIRKHFPEHATLSEEGGRSSACRGYCWIVDPLDGTVNFIHRLPVFSVSVALMLEGEVISSAVHAPLLGETFAAEKGRGAWCNGRRIRVSKIDRLVRSLAVTGFPYDIHTRPGEAMEKLSRVLLKVQGMRRLGSAALDLAYVAMGRFEAFWEEGLSPWDVAGGSLLVTEAGGRISDFGNRGGYIFGKSVLATNGLVHRGMLKLLEGRK